MPWGKYEGRRIDEIDTAYLIWVLEKADRAPLWLKQAIVRELRDRGVEVELSPHEPCPLCGRLAHRPAPPAPPPPPRNGQAAQRVRDVVDRWFRKQSLANHPDRGGDGRVMTAINAAREELAQELARL